MPLKKHIVPVAVLILVLSLSGLLAPPPAWSDYVRIRGSVVNVRQGPGTSYPALFQAEEGEEYALVSIEGLWCRITLADGREAWLFRRLVDVMAGEMSGLSEVDQPAQEEKIEEGGWGPFSILTILIAGILFLLLLRRRKTITRKMGDRLQEMSGYRRNRPFQYDDRTPDRDRWEI
ncbi:MAG: SH3 domain-containing protein [bacterium]|nr:MAG: SH3 domain-containing protein [bacterium]